MRGLELNELAEERLVDDKLVDVVLVVKAFVDEDKRLDETVTLDELVV